jgi:polyhydroxybutyrate depolymerase
MIRIVVILLTSLTVYSCTESNNNTDDLASIETGLFQKEMLFQDSLRSFFVYIPESVQSLESIPLLFTFHGYGSNAERIMSYSGYNELADSLGFIAVYPQGTLLEGRTHWNVGGWTLESPVDDVAFVDSLINQLSNTYPINQERIYANGMSNGGYMSFLLACQSDSRIAAVASITGAMTPQTLEACSPQKPVPVLQIHADTDQTVPYAGDPIWTIGIEDILNYWIANNQADNTAEITALEDVDPNDGSTVEKFVYNAPDTNAPVVHYFVKNGGHDWPGAWGNKDISASEITWEFLSQYSKNDIQN